MNKRTLAWVVILLLTFPLLSQDNVFLVSERSRARHPGEVLRMSLSSFQEVSQVSIEGLGRSFPGFKTETGQWEVLVGIDLDTKPGEYQLEIVARGTAGATLIQTHPLTVEEKKFPTRRLKVDEKYVNPPAQELSRIQRESRKLSAIFSRVTKDSIWREGFLTPVSGVANSGFGKRSILNGQPRSPHSGTDFDAETGTPVRNPNAGRIVLAEDLYYTGKTVIVDHGLGLYSLFAHLSEYNVEVGQTIAKNVILGLAGATGRVTGSHLHWTVRLRTARVDPISLIAVTGNE